MLIVEHRVNTISGLKNVAPEHGVEIDMRHDTRNDRLYLSHDVLVGEKLNATDDLDSYMANFHHAFVVFNVKEAGIEQRCINLAAKYGIPKSKYFLLDVEFPYLYRASRKEGVREIAVRYSEAEPIEMTLAQKGLVDWVWIDTNTTLPLDKATVEKLGGFKTCLVGPDRWSRPNDTIPYLQKIKEFGLPLTAIMVGKEYVHLCEGF
ncbi:MAG: hypothetical protein HYT12_02195 [Candidatus Liptonbacteria bacterium]|nr:hypothetical protein [Candidatus Liptonbacteria bacterium]